MLAGFDATHLSDCLDSVLRMAGEEFGSLLHAQSIDKVKKFLTNDFLEVIQEEIDGHLEMVGCDFRRETLTKIKFISHYRIHGNFQTFPIFSYDFRIAGILMHYILIILRLPPSIANLI